MCRGCSDQTRWQRTWSQVVQLKYAGVQSLTDWLCLGARCCFWLLLSFRSIQLLLFLMLFVFERVWTTSYKALSVTHVWATELIFPLSANQRKMYDLSLLHKVKNKKRLRFCLQKKKKKKEDIWIILVQVRMICLNLLLEGEIGLAIICEQD